jgi:hypothetical protein
VRFQGFCDAHDEKVDRIGSFLSLMEFRALYSRAQAARQAERARSAENTVLYYLKSRVSEKLKDGSSP